MMVSLINNGIHDILLTLLMSYDVTYMSVLYFAVVLPENFFDIKCDLPELKGDNYI